MLTAKKIMKTELITCKREDPVHKAMQLMTDNKVSALPVVDDDMTVVGVITEKDVLQLFYDLENAHAHEVAEYMTAHVVTFEEDDSLLDVCDFLMKNLFRRIPVVNNGVLVGLISVPDIVQYILELQREEASVGV